MQLHFVSRSDYRRVRQDNKFAKDLTKRLFGENGWFIECHCNRLIFCFFKKKKKTVYFIPEGGSNLKGALGFSEFSATLMRQLPEVDCIIVPVGSGCTVAGIVASMPNTVHVIGISCVNDIEAQTKVFSFPFLLSSFFLSSYSFLTLQTQNIRTLLDEISQLRQQPVASWQVLDQYTFGGFHRSTSQLERFICQWNQHYPSIPTEPTYSAKALYALFDLLASEHSIVQRFQSIAFVHTGYRRQQM
jgi:1-aminocyclopropane-1-carboxylate deaminase/D-cysteine desulfhydrase-like pyridoxal-dependent ACC family enzyme